MDPSSGVAQDFSDTVYYTVTAPVDGTQRTYAVVVDVIIGIDEPGYINTVHVAPNPARNKFHIALDVQRAGTYEVRLVDMLGAEVMHRSWSATRGSNHLSMDVSNLPQGMYMVSIESEKARFNTKLQLIK
jgi:hypothetical protein